MKPDASVLLVTPTLRIVANLLTWLRQAGREVRLTTNYESARRMLAEPPEILITELKLGAYNGLQLANRVRAAGTLVIVIGPSDPYFELDAIALGAIYLATHKLTRDSLTAVMECFKRDVRWLPEVPVTPATTLIGDGGSAYVFH